MWCTSSVEAGGKVAVGRGWRQRVQVLGVASGASNKSMGVAEWWLSREGLDMNLGLSR